MRHDDGTTGDVTDQQISDQLAVLNAAYGSNGYQFTLLSINRTDNTAWSTHFPGSAAETAMKNALAINPACTLNFYACDLGGGLLGYATFPNMYPENSNTHGVVNRYATLPGGTAAPFNEGDTCTAPGLDPIQNFMDYSDDACMDQFTLDQEARMDSQVATYKPSLWTGCGASACVLNQSLSFTSGTLNMNFVLMTTVPATWNVYLSVNDIAVSLFSIPLPTISQPISVPLSIPGFPNLGGIGALTTLTTPTSGIICSDWNTVVTGS